MAQTTGEKVLAHLANYKLKSEGSGKYRSISPLRAGSNSMSFTLIIDADGEHGAFDDKAGGQHGSLYELAGLLGIAVESTQEARTSVPDSLQVYKDLGEYAAFKGVPEQAFINAKWSAEPVTYDKRPALTFPTAGGIRYRFLDGKKPKFKSAKGYRACWYGLKVAAQNARANNTPLIICNGEPSVIVAMHFKVWACCITGGEQPTIPDALLAELKSTWDGLIILALDCDEAGRKSATGKAAILRAAGFTVLVIDLGLGDKGDLADLCKLYQADTLAHLLKLAESPVPPAEADPVELGKLVQELTKARKAGEQADVTMPAVLDKLQEELDRARLTNQKDVVQHISTVVSARHKRLDEARKNPSKIQGLRSGIEKLDDLIGGFPPGRIYVLYGDTGMGKSTTAVSIISNFAAQAPGIIIPTESLIGDYLDKMAAYKASVPSDMIETGMVTDEQYRTVMAAYGWFEERHVHFVDEMSPTVKLIETIVRDGIKRFGYQWCAIDSMNNLTSLLHNDLYGKTTEAADLGQRLARLGLVVLETTQIGRNMKNRKNKIPKKNDALGSGKIEQNADVIMALYNHDYYVREGSADPDSRYPAGIMLAKCLKHRHRGGAEGVSRKLAFKGGIGVYDQ
jgi:replicative DNA helicase